YISIFFFINEIFGIKDYPGAYKTVDKAYLILYHMISVDYIAFDGGYYYSIDKFIEYNKTNKKFKRENFIYPYRKINKEQLSEYKKLFNEKFASFRSTIETQYAEVGNIFKKFSNSNAATKTSNIKYYNLQFKICVLLRNIRHYVNKFDIETLEHHTRWFSDDFDLKYNN
ncbi:uncharacterized protein BYT42DRAFT_477869, partial [Radiomyces spectabilis]|uniref:uncharacterized protein n=1 Tax=Radiomyces spectabilis TaxID=64574 RepID=UPI0022212854